MYHDANHITMYDIITDDIIKNQLNIFKIENQLGNQKNC